MAPLKGSLHMLFLYDVAEGIRLEQLRGALGISPESRKLGFRHPAPEYAGFEKPPLSELLDPLVLESGEHWNRVINYYEYGVISIKLELAFSLDWPGLVELSSRWNTSPDIEGHAAQAVEQKVRQIGSALIKPSSHRLAEDYSIVLLNDAGEHDERMPAYRLTAERGAEIAQVVRGEGRPLSSEESDEVLAARMSYYPTDVVVVGWTAAFVYDTGDGADTTMQLLEYANLQLLEFRYYDRKLTELLAGAYDFLEKRKGFLSRWRMAKEAERVNAIRLDLNELAERMDASIKFLSDMFSARLFRMAAGRVGAREYREAVEDKLRTAGELYQFMMDQFHQGRAFLLEAMIVFILIIDLIFLFRGKT